MTAVKDFAVTFIICLFSSYIILFFGGWLIFENLFGALCAFSLIMAVLISWLMNLSDKIDKLENRVKELEEKQKA